MTGARRVAILTILLNQRREVGSKLLASLEKDVAAQVTKMIHDLGSLDPAEVREIEAAFYKDVGHILSSWIREEA